MKIKLCYGRGFTTLIIPRKNVVKVVRPKAYRGLGPKKAFKRALDHPVGDKLKNITDGKKICLLIEDSTRSSPHTELINSIIPRLKKAKEVTAIITTGTHSPKTPENIKIAKLAEKECEKQGLKYEVLIHDCKNSKFKYLGKTSHGTPIYVNKKAIGFDLYVVTSNLKPHYFAGYSNPTKNFIPGVTSFKTAEKNHSLTMDVKSTFGVNPLHPYRRDNPLATDILEGMKMTVKNADVFTLCFVKSGKEIIWAKSGSMKKVVAEGFSKVDETSKYKVKPRKYVIVSPGRFPNDESLYISQRALELTKNAMADTAEVLFISKCENGIAHEEAIEQFYNKLKNPIDGILSEDRERYRLYSHKAHRFASLLKRINKLWVYSSLKDGILEDIHMFPAKSPQGVVDGWLKKDPKAEILIFDNANRLVVY